MSFKVFKCDKIPEGEIWVGHSALGNPRVENRKIENGEFSCEIVMDLYFDVQGIIRTATEESK